MSRKKPENLSFEEALSELEDLVDRLEQGDISLEESLKSFERGIALTRNCQQALVKAEQKVSILSEKTLDAEPETFEVDAKD
ncbi:exodeoxyribonuclease VII small subunit [Thiolapillus sp.]